MLEIGLASRSGQTPGDRTVTSFRNVAGAAGHEDQDGIDGTAGTAALEVSCLPPEGTAFAGRSVWQISPLRHWT